MNSFGVGGSNSHIIMDDAFHALEALSLHGIHHTIRHFAFPCTIENETTVDTMRADTYLTNEETISSTLRDRRWPNGDRIVDETNGIVPPRLNSETDTAFSNSSNSASNDSETPSVISQSTSITSETIATDDTGSSSKYLLLVWSARDEAALKRMLQQYEKYYAAEISGSKNGLDRLAYTLSARRSLMAWRSFAVVASSSELECPLEVAKLSASTCVRSSRKVGLAFVFTGQGAQYAKMGLELIQYPIFHSTLTRTDAIFHDLGAEWSIFGTKFISRPSSL